MCDVFHQSKRPARTGINRLLIRVCITAAAVALFATAGAAQDQRPTSHGSTDFGVNAVQRQVQTGLGPAPFYTLKDDGADFVAAGSTTRRSTGITDPFVIVMPGIPGVEVRSFVQWNWLLNGAAPATDTVSVNGTVVTGTLCGTGTPDLCWGKQGAAAYIAALPAGLVVTGGPNTIGGATDRALGADPLALGEGLSLLTVYRVAGASPRNVDVYCGYTSNLSGPVYGFADAVFAFSNVYSGGLAHYFLNGLDTQNPVPGWEDSFFINGLAAGGAVPGTFPNTNAWRGLLGPLPIDNLYDHADGPLGAPFLTPGDVGMTSTTTFGPLGGGDCIGHSFGAIAFSIKEVFPKWSQLPKDLDEGFNVPSNLDWYQLGLAKPGDPGPGPNVVTADDFQSDGRPITCVRFWGSYIDPNFIPNLPNQPTVALGDRALPFGACCFPDGSCSEQFDFDCADLGGEFLGDNTTCPAGGCFGACCFDLDCTQSTREQCESGAGVWHGYGAACDPNPCDQTGTCFPDAAGQSCTGDCPPGLECVPRCIEFDPQFPDQYRIVDCDCRVPDECQVEAIAGADPQCIFGFCPNPDHVCERTETFDPATGLITVCCDCVAQGACCVPGIACFITSASDCAAQGGSYQGDNVPCVPDPCGQEVGACCLPDNTCFVTTATNCAAQGGSYQGDGTVCGPIGACCLPNGICRTIPEICCLDQGGTFAGGGCSIVFGACCFPDGTCQALSATCCQAFGGTFQGDGVPCNNPNPCIEPPFGACCLPDGTCIIVGPDLCGDLGGIYQGDNVPCSPNPCIDDPSEIDGWLISFHTDLPADQNPDGFSRPERLLALYFAPANAVSVIPTSLSGCDGHRVYEYVVELEDTCLLHSYKDPRAGANPPLPGQPDAFYETAGFIYWLDIQAVVGHTLIDTEICPNCDCDLNLDGVCDAQDLALLQACFGAPPTGACARADITCDGVINADDVAAWQCLAAGNPPAQCCDAVGGTGGECIEVVTEHFAKQDFWGWHTSRDHWNDNSTWGPVVMGPPPAMDWLYPFWTPVPPLCGPNERIDQAFELLTPEPPCPPCPDITGPNNGPPDGVVNLFDLLAMLDAWGPCPPPCPPYCPADVNCDCVVNLFDLLLLLDSWGNCPPTP